MTRMASVALTTVFLTLWLDAPGFGQSTSAEISGTVVDSSGAVIPNMTSLGGENA